jgi:hypothetical protein
MDFKAAERAYFDQFSGDYRAPDFSNTKRIPRNELLAVVNQLHEQGMNVAEISECIGRSQYTVKHAVGSIEMFKSLGAWDDSKGVLRGKVQQFYSTQQ